MAKQREQAFEQSQIPVQDGAQTVSNDAPVDPRAAIAAQIAEMKARQAAQRAQMKQQREAATAALKEQREALKKQREATNADLAAKREAAKAEREAKRAMSAEEKLKKEQEKLQQRAAKDAERLEKERAKLAALQEKVNNPQPEQNGIRRPKSGSKCGNAWDLFDSASTAKGAPVALAEVMPTALAQGQNESNVRVEYSRWRRFHGIVGRVTPEKQAA